VCSSQTGKYKLTSLLPFTAWQFGPKNVPDCNCTERPKEVRLRATPATGATQANNGAAAACRGQRQHEMYLWRAFTLSALLQEGDDIPRGSANTVPVGVSRGTASQTRT